MAEWVRLENRGSVVSKDKQYRNLHMWKGRCALCGVEFITHTPGSAPADKTPTVTTCDEHRGAPKAISGGWAKWDGKNVVPGPKMKIGSVSASGDTGEFEELKKERDEYAENVINLAAERGDLVRKYEAVFNENSVLKARLATYELPAAMSAMNSTENKMPWE